MARIYQRECVFGKARGELAIINVVGNQNQLDNTSTGTEFVYDITVRSAERFQKNLIKVTGFTNAIPTTVFEN